MIVHQMLDNHYDSLIKVTHEDRLICCTNITLIWRAQLAYSAGKLFSRVIVHRYAGVKVVVTLLVCVSVR